VLAMLATMLRTCEPLLRLTVEKLVDNLLLGVDNCDSLLPFASGLQVRAITPTLVHAASRKCG